MRNSLPGVSYRRWIDAEHGCNTVKNGLSYFRAEWQTKGLKSKHKLLPSRATQNRYAFYPLPNGAKATLEQLVIYYPLHDLFELGITEFSIFHIRLRCFYELGIELSYKQVRDALYRLAHSKLVFRHIKNGVYQWQTN